MNEVKELVKIKEWLEVIAYLLGLLLLFFMAGSSAEAVFWGAGVITIYRLVLDFLEMRRRSSE